MYNAYISYLRSQRALALPGRRARDERSARAEAEADETYWYSTVPVPGTRIPVHTE